MRRWIIRAALLWCTASLPVAAVVPETGLYYNPQWQGPGYYIEVQGDTLMMVAFAYDADSGAPLFYYAAGAVTRAQPGNNGETDPPTTPYPYEYPYRFDGTVYRFTRGPCLTCEVLDWITSRHAVVAGHVHLRFADVNRIQASFELGSGQVTGLELWRQGFGRPGYILGRYDGRLLPDLGGDWVFVDRSDSSHTLRFHFSSAGPPDAFHGELFGSIYDGLIRRFSDASAHATLLCERFGCGLQRPGKPTLYIRFWDIGSDRMLAYDGGERGVLERDAYSFDYRSDHLYNVIRIADPIPDAPPPPTE